MSKKTRKKSPKTPAGKPARAKPDSKSESKLKSPSKKPAGTAAKSTSKKIAKATAKKPANKPATRAGKPAVSIPAQESHKAPSKPLKSAARTESVAPVAAAASKAPAAKPAALKLPMAKPVAAKPVAAKPVAAKPVADSAPAPKAAAAAPSSRGLTEGAKAPAFQLPRDGGDTVSLADFKGRKLVLFFYPRADTPGCTKEAIDFSRLSAAFAESQTAVVGVSADPPKAQEAFRNKHELIIPLVSDEQHEMLDAYGVWGEKSMYGRTFLGIVRTTVLIGGDGKVLKVWRNVKVDGHADDVLAAVRAM